MNKLFEEKIRTIISEELRKVLAEQQNRQLNEMARVGFMYKNKFDVFVRTDDAGYIPHVHIVDTTTNGQDFDCCVQLERNQYFSHGHHQDIMNSKLCKEFDDFMRQPCRIPKYKNNYEFAVEMWNMNNSKSYVQIREDENGEIIMPNYKVILPYD